MQNRYNRRNRRKYNLKVHIVLVTKYRKALLQNSIDSFVKRAISYLAEQNDWTIVAMEADKDHPYIAGIRCGRTHLRHHQHHQTENNSLALGTLRRRAIQAILEETHLLVRRILCL